MRRLAVLLLLALAVTMAAAKRKNSGSVSTRRFRVTDLSQVVLDKNDTRWALKDLGGPEDQGPLLEGAVGAEPTLDRELQGLGVLLLRNKEGSVSEVVTPARLAWRCKLKVGDSPQVKCKAKDTEVTTGKAIKYKLKFRMLEEQQQQQQEQRDTEGAAKPLKLTLQSACIKLKNSNKKNKGNKRAEATNSTVVSPLASLERFAMHVTYGNESATPLDAALLSTQDCAPTRLARSKGKKKKKCRVEIFMSPNLANGLLKFDDFLNNGRDVTLRRLQFEVRDSSSSSEFAHFLQSYVQPAEQVQQVQCLDASWRQETTGCGLGPAVWNLLDPTSRLRSLRALNCNFTYESDVISGSGSNSSLAMLDLSMNRFERLPRGLEHLQALRFLNLSRQMLAPGRAFQLAGEESPAVMTSLETLDLSYTPLAPVDKRSFLSTPNLSHLGLRGCGLTHLPEDSLWSLRRLSVLDLSHNQLTQLAPATLQHLAPGFTADLRGNPLPQLPPLTIDSQDYLIVAANRSLTHGKRRKHGKNRAGAFRCLDEDM